MYGPADLFVYINGQAELYLSYGFLRVVAGTFVSSAAPDQAIVVDVYDMGSRLKAEEPAHPAAEYLARQIARSLPTDSGLPVELGYLPDGGLIQGTRRYIPEALFGYDFIPRGIQGRYETDPSPVVLFVVLCASEGEEPYYGGVMVARSGRFIAGVRDLSIPTGVHAGRKHVGEMLERLGE